MALARTTFFGMAILIACDKPAPAFAATEVTSFGVSATVVAYCAIASETLLSHPVAVSRSPNGVCAPARSMPGVSGRPATVTFGHDAAAGMSILTIEF
jgi:hypothetical protein